jgi:transposase
VVIECSLRRVRCPNHGVRIEAVPFARPGTRVTRDVENLVVWCAKTMDWTAASVLCRVSWRTVNRIIERVVPTTADLSRIEGIVRIGVDEISWKRGHKYLTLVVDHDTGQVIWGAKDRRAVTLEAFFEQLGPDKTAQLEAISMDFGAPYAKATRENAPNAAICFDPFHAVAMATKALDTPAAISGVRCARSTPTRRRRSRAPGSCC